MTVFMGVDGAVQQELSTIGILLILILFTSCFPAYVYIFAFLRRHGQPPLYNGARSFKAPLSTNFSSKSAKTSARVSDSAFSLSPSLPW
jgi:hypothetical protein